MLKICAACKKAKNQKEFCAQKASKDGLHGYCRECNKIRSKERYRATLGAERAATRELRQTQARERRREYVKEWRSRNKDRQQSLIREWKSTHKEQEAIRLKTWADNNRDKRTSSENKRRITKIKAIPKWCDMNKVDEVYTKAQEISRETGIVHHVDHIVPLRSKIVCGLHCADNLQILPKLDNLKKGNSTWPGASHNG